ncbi:MAG: alpha/beta hydrolase family protein [Bacillota bacterium]
MKFFRTISLILTFAFFLGPFELPAQQKDSSEKPISGYYKGYIEILGQKLNIEVKFTSGKDSLNGTIDIPQQGAHGLALSEIKYASPKIHFELPNPAMPARVAIFDGELKDSTVSGQFKQLGMTGVFTLKIAEEVLEKDEPVPYKQEEVSFKNGDIKLAGTLTYPERKGKFPAIIMITGSGPQNRDEELFGFKPFKIIADHFTRAGFAVLRYDDRGVGGSTGSTRNSTTEDFASDALSAVEFLKTLPEIDPLKIGLCGHSEGGIVAPLAASRSNNVAFIILISGTGVTGEGIIKAQTQLLMKASGQTDQAIEEQIKLQQKIFNAVRTNEGWDEVKAIIFKDMEKSFNSLSDEVKKQIPDKVVYINKTVEAQIDAERTPWFRYFIDYDPLPALEKVKCPVLMLFGQKDLQVPTELNRDWMIKALEKGGNKNYTVKEFPDANHLYIKAVTGGAEEYATLEKKFVPGFLDFMTGWLKKLYPEVTDTGAVKN